jgi:hypothetical protein
MLMLPLPAGSVERAVRALEKQCLSVAASGSAASAPLVNCRCETLATMPAPLAPPAARSGTSHRNTCCLLKAAAAPLAVMTAWQQQQQRLRLQQAAAAAAPAALSTN